MVVGLIATFVVADPLAEPGSPQPTVVPTQQPTVAPTRQDRRADDGLTQVLTVDFERSPIGRYNRATAERDWGGGLEGFSHKRGETHVVRDGDRKVLRVTQPAGTVGQAPTWHVNLPEYYDFARLEYRVKFGTGFQFGRKGGKLPGLGGTRVGTVADACTPRDGTESFSARVMWRFVEERDDARGGQLEAYTYHPDKTDECGEEERFPAYLQDDTWYRISMDVRMNTPGRHNGQFVIRLDGKEVYRRTNFMWRESIDGEPAFGIQRLNFHSFFGGKPGTGFEHSRREHIYYDDLRLLVD